MSEPTNEPNGAGPVPPSKPPQMQGPLVMQQFAPPWDGVTMPGPFTKEEQTILLATPEHEQVEIKPDGICFMPGVWWRRRLTKAFGIGNWTIAQRGPDRREGNEVIYFGALYIRGKWVQEAKGTCDAGTWMSYGDALEGAKTDCLSKCCKTGLTMASELWDRAWRDAWQNEYCEMYEVKSGKDQGKKRWRLKAKREPHAANLMGVPPDVSAAPSESTSSESPTPPTTATVPPASPGGPDNGEAAGNEAYEAIAGQFRRLKWTKKGVTGWVSKHFGVPTHTAMTKDQCVSAQVLLMAHDKPDMYARLMEGMVAEGKISP